MSDTSTPKQPDYVGAANATAQGNIDAARSQTTANRVDQYTPYGSLSFKRDKGAFDQAGYDAALANYNTKLAAYSAAPTVNTAGMFGGDPNAYGQASITQNASGNMPTAPDKNDFFANGKDGGWSATQTLDPAQQQLLDQQNKTSLNMAGLTDQASGAVGNALSHQITAADLPANMVNPGQTGQDALMARFQPMIDQSHKAVDAQLANQGIMPGSEAYTNAMRTQSQGENDLRSQAALNGIKIGQDAQTQQLGNAITLQDQPLSMLNALRSGSQVTNPTFNGVPQQGQTAGADLMGATGQQSAANMGLYNSQVATNNSNTGAIAGVAAAGIAAF